MAILLPLQMVLVMLQCWPAHATMYHIMAYSDSACTTQTDSQWRTAEVCAPHSSSGGYLKWTCNGAYGEARIYSDAACATLKADYNEAPYVVNGVFASNGACFDKMENGTSYAKYLCSDQPAQMTFNLFTDASCTQANHSEGPQMKFALDVCMYETDDGTVKAEKFTGSASALSQNKYTTNDCSGTGTADMSWSFADASTCVMAGGGNYVKYVSMLTAEEAAAAVPPAPAATAPTASGSVSIPASLTAMLMLVKTLL